MPNDPSFLDFLSMVKRHVFWLIGPVIVCVVLALVWLRMTPPHYTAMMTVGPTASDGVAGRGTRLTYQPSLSDYSRSAPIETDDNEALSDFARFLELLRSSEVASRLIQNDPETLRKIFPAEWDERRQTWQRPQGVGTFIMGAVHGLVGYPGWVKPDAGRLSDVLKRDIVIDPVGSSAMRRVRFRHPDRAFTIRLLNALHYHADEYLRDQARRRTAQEIDYIKMNLQTITLAEHRRALTEILAVQEQTQMMINVDLPFAADRIEAAYAPSVPDWPSPLMTLLAIIGVGLVAGVVLVYYRETAHG